LERDNIVIIVIASSRTIDTAGVADHYNELDLFYREIWGEHVHHGLWINGNEDSGQAVVQLVQLVAEKARITHGARVCDIGCGYGAAARFLARQMGACVTAITVSESQHSYACKVDPSGNPNYLLSDWLKTELIPASFDAAFAIESSEHMPDKVKFFSHALDILKLGSRLVVCSWLAAEASSGSQKKWLLEPICREGCMPHLLNAGELVTAARRAGFRAIEYQDISHEVSRTWSIVISRFAQRLISDSRYRSFLFHSGRHNRAFAVTIFRIWLAYQTRTMRYGIFTFAK
jgi:cyclopropane fatty-acyl-phospholipid synthase-like methyltransferase